MTPFPSQVPAYARVRSPESVRAELTYNEAVVVAGREDLPSLRRMVMAHLATYPKGINDAHPRD